MDSTQRSFASSTSGAKREHSKEITTSIFRPGQRFFVLNLEIKNRPGDLAAMTSLLTQSHIQILNASFTRGMPGKPGTWQLFVEPQDQKMPAEDLVKLVQSDRDVLNCKVAESRDGFLIDPITFPIMVNPLQRGLLLPNDVWMGMIQKTREKFGPGAEVIVYDQGAMAGRVAGKELLMALGKEKIGQQMDQVIMMYQALGWGKAKVTNLRTYPLYFVIRFFENAECMGLKSPKPTSHFIRGQIVGICDILFGFETKCTETSCMAVGNEFCEFVVEAKSTSKVEVANAKGRPRLGGG